MRESKKMTESQKNRIVVKIEKFKKALKKEKSMFGAYHDGGGYRYEIAHLYFELSDYKKTNRYLNWFDKNFPDDGKYLYYELGEAVTKYELGKLKEAKLSTIKLNSHNTYLIDLLIGNDINDQDKYEWIESESLTWIKDNFESHYKLTTEDYLDWLRELRAKESYQNWYNKLIAIMKLLKGLDVSHQRSELLEAQWNCIKEWQLDS